ncbi:MAG TPA: hypothetical protein VN799_11180 [Acidimicrobiales bacterium]|nr:hypothetical protein [Acidimicrobiales bacterium]
MGTCVFVIGMHRSGTSAVTGMLTRLGVEAPAEDDLVPATAFNERGHFESKNLMRFDNDVLRLLGGTWSAPPPLVPGWERQPALEGLRHDAPAAFAATFPTRPMAWKDPRNCLLLPFWRSLVPPPMAAVLVYRDGMEVAKSLRTRNDITLTHGLALWERYVRTSCADLVGLPTLVTGYARMLDDPAAWGRTLTGFLADVGVAVDPGRADAAVASLDAGLRHERTTTDRPAGIGGSQHDVLAVLQGLDGAHARWSPPDLGVEPEWVEDVLALRREYEVLRRQYRSVESSRVFRLVKAWWKMRGPARSPISEERG